MNTRFDNTTFNDIKGNYTQNTTQVYVNTEEILAKFKKWLNAPDPSTNHNNARQKHYKNTGQWLLQDSRYMAWKQQPNSFLWINGISGCGKTLICSTIIENIKSIILNQPETGLAYFFFDINDTAKQTSRSLLSSLVLGLTAKSNNHVPMEKLYNRHDKLYNPTEDELLTLLLELLQCFKQAHVYLVIDALDECLDYYQLFDQVIKFVHEQGLPHLHLLVSSRREQHIINTMEECIPSEIYLSAELISGDIISYVHAIVGKDYRMRRWSPAIQQDVKNALINGANGMFRWVACQIEELRHCPNQYVLMETLKSLPKDLKATYDQILHRIHDREMPSAKVILQWLVFGMRPLKPDELAVVITFNPFSGKFDSSLKLAHPDDVIQLCSSLVVKGADNTVKLAHASVKEYFLNQAALFDLGSSHASIAHCCLRYLLQDGWNKWHFYGKKFPLLEYSTPHWLDHYKNSNKDKELQNVVILFFKAEDGAFKRWKEIYLHPKKIKSQFGQLSSLKYAVLLGLDDIIEILATETNWEPGSYDSTLELAVQLGHIDMVRILLEKGGDANIQSMGCGNALCTASHQGNAEIVKLLLDKRVDVNAQGRDYGNALFAAIDMGHTEIAKLLLERGADVCAQSEEYDNALIAAIRAGHIKIVQLIMDKGVDFPVSAVHYALPEAMYMGQIDIAKLLLDNEADINAQSGQHGGALQAAAKVGNIESVKLLLDMGVDMNIQDQYSNALELASSRGHAEVVKLLLDKGIELDYESGEYGKALQIAANYCQTEIVKLLVDKGPDVNSWGEQYGNALQRAANRGCVEIVKLLLEKGADVNLQVGEYGSALEAAAHGGFTEIVNLLLDKGADVNAENPFQAVSARGHTEIVKLLLHQQASKNIHSSDLW